jgi:ABC-type Fe3+ transport system substrate-binding protein
MALRLRAAVLAFCLSLAGGANCAMAADAADILNYRGADREQRLLEGAKAEGQVVIYSTVIVNQALRPLTEAFMQKYPFMKATYWRGDIGDMMAKLSAEYRADKLVADVVEGSLGEIAVEAGIVQPFYTPMVADYPDAYRDPNRNWVPTRLNYFGLAINTKLLPEGQGPRTYDDLLDPKWKGKMAWRIDECCGHILFITGLRKAWGEEKAMDYFKKLSEQRIVNFAAGSARTLVDRVMAGEYPIAINIFAHHPLISAGKGASVRTQLLDPAPSSAAAVMVLKGLKRPYAAMLLVDFILSNDGQEILSKAEYFPARTNTPALPSIAGAVPKNVGVRENFVSPIEASAMSERSAQIYNEVFRN